MVPSGDPIAKICSGIEKELDEVSSALLEISLGTSRDQTTVMEMSLDEIEGRLAVLREIQPDCKKLKLDYDKHYREYKLIVFEHIFMVRSWAREMRGEQVRLKHNLDELRKIWDLLDGKGIRLSYLSDIIHENVKGSSARSSVDQEYVKCDVRYDIVKKEVANKVTIASEEVSKLIAWLERSQSILDALGELCINSHKLLEVDSEIPYAASAYDEIRSIKKGASKKRCVRCGQVITL